MELGQCPGHLSLLSHICSHHGAFRSAVLVAHVRTFPREKKIPIPAFKRKRFIQTGPTSPNSHSHVSFLRVGSQLWIQDCINLPCFSINFYFIVNKRARFTTWVWPFLRRLRPDLPCSVPAGFPRAGDRRRDAAPPDRGALTEQHGAETGARAQDQVTGRNVSCAAPSGAV